MCLLRRGGENAAGPVGDDSAGPDPDRRVSPAMRDHDAPVGAHVPGQASLARLFREFGDRWDIEKVQRGTEWVAVGRESGGDYVRIVSAHDIGALRYRMNQAEQEQPGEHELRA